MTRCIQYTAVTLAALALLMTTGAGHAAELAGVQMADSYTLGNEHLVLNGMAVRDKFFIKVYVGGLYLQKRTSNAEDIIRADTPKALLMQFVRDVKRDKLVQAYSEAFASNAADMAARQKTNVERFLPFSPTSKKATASASSTNQARARASRSMALKNWPSTARSSPICSCWSISARARRRRK